MLTVEIFKELVIRPPLMRFDLYSEAAENLLLGTALHESGGFRWTEQLDGGPARGFYQMEPDTLKDLYLSWLKYRPDRHKELESLRPRYMDEHEALSCMPAYATLAARLQYLRDPESLPPYDDIRALARYWKRVWNTEKGKGTEQQFVDAWNRYAEAETGIRA